MATAFADLCVVPWVVGMWPWSGTNSRCSSVLLVCISYCGPQGAAGCDLPWRFCAKLSRVHVLSRSPGPASDSRDLAVPYGALLTGLAHGLSFLEAFGKTASGIQIFSTARYHF